MCTCFLSDVNLLSGVEATVVCVHEPFYLKSRSPERGKTWEKIAKLEHASWFKVLDTCQVCLWLVYCSDYQTCTKAEGWEKSIRFRSREDRIRYLIERKKDKITGESICEQAMSIQSKRKW